MNNWNMRHKFSRKYLFRYRLKLAENLPWSFCITRQRNAWPCISAHANTRDCEGIFKYALTIIKLVWIFANSWSTSNVFIRLLNLLCVSGSFYEFSFFVILVRHSSCLHLNSNLKSLNTRHFRFKMKKNST